MLVRETNTLLTTLRAIRASGRMALCGYFLVGYPSPDEFFGIVRAVRDLDVIEFGIPADQPSLDGPVIASAHRVVTGQRGIHAEPALALIGGLRDVPQPRFVMTYAAVGRALDGFLRLCVENGIHGVLAPDADMTEGRFIADKAHALGLASITLLDARADEETLRNCVEIGDLIYVKASAGATGRSADLKGALGDAVPRTIDRVRAVDATIPIGVGVGIQRPEQVAALAALGADMVIVGTRIVEEVEAGQAALVEYVRALRAATYYPEGTRE